MPKIQLRFILKKKKSICHITRMHDNAGLFWQYSNVHCTKNSKPGSLLQSDHPGVLCVGNPAMAARQLTHQTSRDNGSKPSDQSVSQSAVPEVGAASEPNVAAGQPVSHPVGSSVSCGNSKVRLSGACDVCVYTSLSLFHSPCPTVFSSCSPPFISLLRLFLHLSFSPSVSVCVSRCVAPSV